MTLISLGEAFLVNPAVSIPKGTEVAFVPMDAIQPFTRTVTTNLVKPFSGGVKFVDGDVLMARITPSLENGKTSIYRASIDRPGPAFGSTEFLVIRGREGVSDSGFAYYLFTSDQIRRFSISQMSGTSGRQRVQRDALERYVADLPSIEEQRGIAEALGALDDKIESNRRAIFISEGLVQAHFELRSSFEQDDSGVPVSELLTINAKRSLRKGTLATYVGMSSILGFSAEINNWEAREFGSGQKFVNGDVLMARITPCLENGKTAVVDMLSEGEVGWGSTEYIVFSPDRHFSTPWIYSLLRSAPVRAWAIRSMTGTSGRQRLQTEAFDHYKITRPHDRNLSRFNAFAAPLFARMTQLRDETRKLASLRDVLLPELISGRMRVAQGAAAMEEAMA